MNEGRTSAIFAVVAAVSLGLAWMSRPEAIYDENDLKTQVTGQPVFAKFEDPAEAASFQIIKYDEALGQLERFEVAKDKTSSMWKLPSYDDYPADAAEQVRDATTPLISMPILNVSSLDRGDHSLYGVINPDSDDLSVGESGVGMLLRVKGDANQVLAELVVGKEVDGVQGQRYVRVPTEDATYVVELDTAPFTTEFPKWINQKLLEIRSFDIASVGLRDYAILPTQQGYGMSRNFDADLSFDSAANKWTLDRLLTYKDGKAVVDSVPEGEVLKDDSLNNLRNAVQDLDIVNVRRKPTGLAADLKADKSLMENKESLQSLVSQGFIPQEGPNGTEIFATGGETLVGTQMGVKYLLRFGETVTKLSENEEESGLRRYLLVSAVLDDSKFPPPELQPLPETVEEMLALQKSEATSAVEPPANNAPDQPTPVGDEAVEGANNGDSSPETPPSPKLKSANTQDSPTAADAPETTPAEPAPKADEPSPAASSDPATADDCSPQEPSESQAGDDKTAVAPTGDSQPESSVSPTDPLLTDAPVDAPAADTAAAPVAQEAPPKKTDEELKEELEFVREQIAKENQRKIDDRKEKMDAARKRVLELNARFADWYYVVSDSVYKKLKISREQLIGPPTVPGAGGASGQSPNSFGPEGFDPSQFNFSPQ